MAIITREDDHITVKEDDNAMSGGEEDKMDERD